MLRDVTLIPTDKQGQEIEPTEFLTKYVLSLSKSLRESRINDIKSAILNYFPKVECKILPPPSADLQIMQNIETSQAELSEAFDRGVEDLLQYLLENVHPKQGFFPSSPPINGNTLVELAIQYIKAVNEPSTVPCLGNTWETVVSLRCSTIHAELIKEYEKEMEEAVAGKFPMDDVQDEQQQTTDRRPTLMGIHHRILTMKCESLCKQTMHLLPAEGNTGEGLESVQQQLQKFKQHIAEYESEEVTHGNHKVAKLRVKGGILFKFTKQNFDASFDHCTQLFDQLFQQIKKKVLASDPKYKFQHLLDDLEKARLVYISKAIGPAKWIVLNDKRAEVESQKELFESVEGFQKAEFEARQKAEAAEAEVNELTEKVLALKADIKANQEAFEQEMEALQNQQELKIAQMEEHQIEEMQRELKKQQALLDARMNTAAEIAEAKEEELKQEYQEKLKRLKHNLESIQTQKVSGVSKFHENVRGKSKSC